MAPSVEVGYSAPSVTLDARGLPILEKDMGFKPIDVELVRSLLHYDPSVGGSCLVWKVDRCSGANGNKTQAHAGDMAGYVDAKGYYRLKINSVSYYAHRLVWVVVQGEDPPCQVDHVLGHEVGNHIENLRLAFNNNADNGQNKKRFKNNKSGYTGVFWVKHIGKWEAYISNKGKRIVLGYFDTPEEAYEAYLKAKKELHTFNPACRADVT